MITPFSNLHEPTFQLEEDPEIYRRRGAGGGGGGSGAGGGHGGGRGGGGSRPKPKPSGVPNLVNIPRTPVPITLNGRALNALPFGNGTTRAQRGYFAKSHPFRARECGGGIRDSVYGNSIYGSGYPGQAERGVEGRNFPFFFYPITFPAANGPVYLYREGEYGNATDPSRPGGPLFQFSVYPVVSSQTASPYKFHVVSDNATTQFLMTAIVNSCTKSNVAPSGLNIDAPVPVTNGQSGDSTEYIPRPEDVIQYYRASSVAFLLEGYNNTDLVFHPTDTTLTNPAQALSPNISRTFIDCVNHTIGMSVPLVGGAVPRAAPNAMENGVYAGLMSVFIIWFSFCSWVL